MFKKKPSVKEPIFCRIMLANVAQIKPLAPLRSSDRRKIADQIIADFNIEVPSSEEKDDDVNDQASSALTLGALRNALLPENALSARFTTTAGPNLSTVSGTVYAGAHPGEEQRILWFKVDERLIPTGPLSAQPDQSHIDDNFSYSVHPMAAS